MNYSLPKDAARKLTPLKNARLTAGLTQTELAIRTGLAPQRISAFERGAGRPSKQTAIKLAAGLNQAVQDIFPAFDQLVDYVYPEKRGVQND